MTRPESPALAAGRAVWSAPGQSPGTLMVLSRITAALTSGCLDEDGSVVAHLGAGADPIWSPLGMLVLYQSYAERRAGGRALRWRYRRGRADLGSRRRTARCRTSRPAGPVRRPTTCARPVTKRAPVILYAYDVNTGETTELWLVDRRLAVRRTPDPDR